ncbi:MAG: hypothetical protein DA408_09275 [Bacteroidetes bacterium]|nr:MAG: hypothetical protein C7N36_09245 [Bacteroidota bacterium]PTM12788.1 MAG: hypothetical protein DA408_09275 [Bacteroidota bacterium]
MQSCRDMKYFLSLLLSIAFFSLLGQQSLPGGQNYYDDGNAGIVYNKELTFDLKLITPRSFAFGVNVGQIISYDRTRFYSFDFGDLRNAQEYRQNFDYLFQSFNRVSRAFVYAKQNSAFVLRAGIGEKRYFSEKAKNRGLAVGISYAAGIDLGILKPYYLELVRSQDPGTPSRRDFISEERYSVANESLFLNYNGNNILGAASFSKGLNEIKVMPGFHLKAAAHFDWGAFDEFVKALEAGVLIDVFLKDVPIMVESSAIPNIQNRPLFFNFYLNLQLGKRW